MEIKTKRTIAILLVVFFVLSITATAVNASEFKASEKIKFYNNRVDKLGHDGLYFTDMSTGSPTTWKWDFGDGINLK